MVGGNWWGRQGEIGSWTSALLGGGDGGGLLRGLHFWGFPCSPAGKLSTARGGAEGSKTWGSGEARELWVIICY